MCDYLVALMVQCHRMGESPANIDPDPYFPVLHDLFLSQHTDRSDDPVYRHPGKPIFGFPGSTG